MNKEKITEFAQYLAMLERISLNDVVLFRGQHEDKPLLPRIARPNPRKNTVTTEKAMLDEVKRRARLYAPDVAGMDDWDVLVYAQHYGMVTRLLDWTQNPLTGLWFACSNRDAARSSWVYAFTPPRDAFMDATSWKDGPFGQGKTKVVKPNLNNPRIVAQEGWFTVHRFSKTASAFVPLDGNRELGAAVVGLEIPGDLKQEFLKRLALIGVHYETVFPEMSGLAKHLNWVHGY